MCFRAYRASFYQFNFIKSVNVCGPNKCELSATDLCPHPLCPLSPFLLLTQQVGSMFSHFPNTFSSGPGLRLALYSSPNLSLSSSDQSSLIAFLKWKTSCLRQMLRACLQFPLLFICILCCLDSPIIRLDS